MAELLGQDMAELLGQEHHGRSPERKQLNNVFGRISKSKTKAVQSALQSPTNMVMWGQLGNYLWCICRHQMWGDCAWVDSVVQVTGYLVFINVISGASAIIPAILVWPTTARHEAKQLMKQTTLVASA